MNDVGGRIYIVEDEAIIQLEIKEHLSTHGYVVCGSAPTGEIALREIPEIEPDLVLMDIKLRGELDGIETASRLRAVAPSAVVFLTAFGGEELQRRAVQTEPFGYLVKPFEERELVATVRMALRRLGVERVLQETNEHLTQQVCDRTADLVMELGRVKDMQRVAKMGEWQLELGSGALTWSDTLYEIFDCDPSRFRPTATRFYEEIVHPDDRAKLRQVQTDSIATGERYSVDHRFCRSDGSQGWVHSEGHPEYNHEGHPVRIGGTTQDISERKQLEQQIDALQRTADD